jgi:exosortase/archaeosortase family protein
MLKSNLLKGELIRSAMLPPSERTTALRMKHRALFSQRELAIWTALALLANNLASVFMASYGGRFDWDWIERSGVGRFNALASGVAIWRLFRAPSDRMATPIDAAIVFGLCLFSGLKPPEAGLLALTGFAVWLLSRDDSETITAGYLLLAVAIHQMWAQLIFDFASPIILRLDTAITGNVMSLFVRGVRWQDNLITMPSGFGVAVLEGCSSFANIFSGLLAWITFLKLERTRWVRNDLWVALFAIVAQVALNTCRLILVVQSEPMYSYWHNGAGAQIYGTTASITAVLIGVLGSRWAASKA